MQNSVQRNCLIFKQFYLGIEFALFRRIKAKSEVNGGNYGSGK